MVSPVHTGSDILPLSPCLDTALTARHSLQAGWELRLAESLLRLVINFPTACISGTALGNAETRLCSRGIRPSGPAACSHPSMLPSPRSCRHRHWTLGFLGQTWVFQAPQLRKVGFHHGIQRNRSLRAPWRDMKLKTTCFKNEIL